MGAGTVFFQSIGAEGTAEGAAPGGLDHHEMVLEDPRVVGGDGRQHVVGREGGDADVHQHRGWGFDDALFFVVVGQAVDAGKPTGRLGGQVAHGG